MHVYEGSLEKAGVVVGRKGGDELTVRPGLVSSYVQGCAPGNETQALAVNPSGKKMSLVKDWGSDSRYAPRIWAVHPTDQQTFTV